MTEKGSWRVVAVLVLGVVAGALLFVAPGTGHAQARTVALLTFLGRGGEAARRASAERVASIGAVVPRTRLRAALRDGGMPVTDSGYAALARRLDAHVIVVARENGEATHIEVRGQSGSLLAQREGPLPRGANARAELAAATFSAVSAAVRTLDLRDDAAREQALYLRQAAADEQAREEAARPPELQPEPSPPPLPADARPLVEVTAGADLRTRRLEIDMASGERAVHDAGIFPEITLAARLHPLRGTGSGLLRGLYAELGGSYALAATSEERAQSGEISTSAVRFEGVAGVEVDLGRARIGLALGGGLDQVSLGDNDVLPSASYGYVRVAPTFRYELDKDGSLALDVALGARLALGLGALRTFYGESGSAWALDARVGLEGRLGALVLGADLSASRWALDFLPSDLDNRESAQGGQDLSLSLGLRAGLAL